MMALGGRAVSYDRGTPVNSPLGGVATGSAGPTPCTLNEEMGERRGEMRVGRGENRV